jgi:hypothetical protein
MGPAAVENIERMVTLIADTARSTSAALPLASLLLT